MKSNFEFVEFRNHQLVFREITSRTEYWLREPYIYNDNQNDIHLRQGDIVMLPTGNGGTFDVWNIRENRRLKTNASLNDQDY